MGKHLSTPAQRLDWAIRRAGFRSVAEFARSISAHDVTVRSHANGNRQFDMRWARRYGAALGVNPLWLLYGFGAPDAEETTTTSPETVPLVGHVGAGAEIFPPDEDQELDRVPAPWREARELAAVIVRGGSMEPEFWDGDLIFYEPPNGMSDPEELVGRTVVCRTEDGRTFVKRLLRGSKPGLWTLESHAAPPMKDVRLVWVAPIRYIKRAGP